MGRYLRPVRAGAGGRRWFGHSWLFLLSLTLLLALLNGWVAGGSRLGARGALDPTTYPRQLELAVAEAAPIVWQQGNFTWTVTPRARYRIAGRVLSHHDYDQDWQSEIAPLDLALAWGELSDPQVDQWIEWWQDGRWYRYRWLENSPYQGEAINQRSANVHIIPATAKIAAALKRLQTNDRVLLEGYLVDVAAHKSGETIIWQLNTSLSRSDTGDGACEILYVRQVVLDSP
jgi:hypothetical protein